MSELLNRLIADRLDQAARILERDGANSLYVRAYSLAASSVRRWPISMAVIYTHRGLEGLEEVPGVGPHIARVIRQSATMEEAARILAIDPATLYRKRKKIALEE